MNHENTLRAAIAELQAECKELRTAIMDICSLQVERNKTGMVLGAYRKVANNLGAPFSIARVEQELDSKFATEVLVRCWKCKVTLDSPFQSKPQDPGGIGTFCHYYADILGVESDELDRGEFARAYSMAMGWVEDSESKWTCPDDVFLITQQGGEG